MEKIAIRRDDHQAMLEQLQAAYPLEACGIMAGKGGLVKRLYPVENQLKSPHAYKMEPHQQLEAMLDLEEKGWEMLAIYHSHPMGPDVPSPMDVAQATYPDAAHVIVSLRERQRPSVRAFLIADEMVDEIPYYLL
ncbi:MAG: M67 family metallopeptidase [Chloroflexota bacterium]